ncbi:UPF0104 family protein [Streptomyces broussonetiae]|uniref:UPF0104 family protein n=1 Tax=Streptomyces broussonetiae TaxID=2686304 RepID=A0A6I6NBI1_9ACTN|nr:UPF0104 family protein [Streptomyces broussonetiae]
MTARTTATDRASRTTGADPRAGATPSGPRRSRVRGADAGQAAGMGGSASADAVRAGGVGERAGGTPGDTAHARVRGAEAEPQVGAGGGAPSEVPAHGAAFTPAHTSPTAPAHTSPTAPAHTSPTAPVPAHAPASEPGSVSAPTSGEAPASRRRGPRTLRAHLGTLAGAVILGVLLWRLGTGALLDGLRRIDTESLLAALGIGGVTTVLSAWRWHLVARGLRIRLPLGSAVADYYRALFLNAALPGGVLGDVHRAVRHGQSAGDLRRAVKAVVLERVAGQIALAVFGAAALLVLPSPVRDDARNVAPLAALAAAGAFAVVAALRMNRAPTRRHGPLHSLLGEARQGLLSRQTGPGVALASAVILAGHLATFVVAARVTGCAAPVAVLVPLAVLALVAMGLPLNVGGFGPREGVTAWAFGAAGLGASSGVAVAVVYGVLSFVASLPGAVVLLARWSAGLRGYARTSPASSGAVSSANTAEKDSTRAASSSFPFSADPREGRPMTPDSV